MRVARGDVLQKLHEPELIHARLLRTHVLLPEELLPPLLALLLQVPLLKVIDQGNMVELTGIDGRPDSVQPLPKLGVGRRAIPSDPHDKQRVINDVQIPQKLSVYPQLSPQFLGQRGIDFNLVLQMNEIQILQDRSPDQVLILILAFLQDLPIVSRALHVVGPRDLFALAPRDVLHQQDVVLLVDLLVLDLEHAVDLGDESVAVGEVVAVEALQVLQQEVELQFVYGLEDVLVVGGEEEKLAALAAVALDQLVELVAVLQQVKTAPKLEHLVLP